jgi:hypothetical protein
MLDVNVAKSIKKQGSGSGELNEKVIIVDYGEL